MAHVVPILISVHVAWLGQEEIRVETIAIRESISMLASWAIFPMVVLLLAIFIWRYLYVAGHVSSI